VAKLTIHAKEDPKESYLEVGGERLAGVDAVVVTQALTSGQVAVTFNAQAGDVEVVWEDS
jgi:hypothetical protein